MSALEPCPFCGGGETRISENRHSPTMSGSSGLISVEITHWCPAVPGQPSRNTVTRTGRDHASAIAAWNTRATPAEVETLRAELAAAREALRDARLQLEYLDSRWPTGTTPPILTRISTALGDTPMTGTLTDRWNNDEPDDPTAGQPDNPQQWRRDPPEPKKPPGYEDKPQRWHKD